MIIRLLNKIIPKSKSQICINTLPDYDDQTRALLEELTTQKNKHHIVILTTQKDQNRQIPEWAKRENVSHITKHSFRGIWSYFRSKYVFFSHGCLSTTQPVSTQTTVNIWHGMPIKKIGYHVEGNQINVFSTFGVATSTFFKSIISDAFAMSPQKVLEVGLPRNDIFFNRKADHLKEILSNGQKIIMWLPTYRQSNVEIIGLNGKTEKNIFNLPDLDIESLNTTLKKLNIVAVVKAHPLSIQADKNQKSLEKSNIRIISETWLLENNTTLNEVLSLSDLLITDMSSVLIDYLLLDQPIICHFPDKEEYSKSRGLIWDFQPDEYGIPIVETQNELIAEIHKMVGFDDSFKGYPMLKKKMHLYSSHFTKRLLDKINF